jgi:hypothetical protein
MITKRTLVLLLFAVLLAFPIAASAQATAGPNVAQIFFNTAKPGSEAQYEAARKRHMNWHRNQNDKWTWYTYQVMTGPATGHYTVGTFGHNWTDFDGREKFEAADNVDANSSMGPYEASVTSAFYVLRTDLSLKPSEAPSPYVSVATFILHPNGVKDFTDSIKKINDGIRKVNYGPQNGRWYQLWNGGEGPEFVLVNPRNSISELKPLDKTLEQAMAEAYGADEGAAVLSTLRKAVKSTMSQFLQYRSDLSYVPAGGSAGAK